MTQTSPTASRGRHRATVTALLRFHGASGIRRGLRAVAPLVVLLLALPVYLGPAFIESFTRSLFPTLAAPAGGDLLLLQIGNLWAYGLTAVLLSVTVPACRALRRDLVGSLRSLPFSEQQRARAMHLAAMVVAAPLVGWILLAMVARTSLSDGRPVILLLGVPCLVLTTVALGGAATTHQTVHRGLWAASVACALQISGLGLLLAAALILGLVWRGHQHGALPEQHVRSPQHTPRRHSRPTDRLSAALLPVVWNLRPLAWRRILSAYLGAGFAALPILFFLVNNDLPAWIVTRAVILGTAAASLALVHAVHVSYDLHRPPLRWERSLPWSSRRRLSHDLVALGLFLAPLTLASGWARPTALPALLTVQIFLALRWIVHQRTGTHSLIGTPGQQLLAEGALVSLLATVAPIPAMVLLVLTVWPLGHQAVQSEKRLRVSLSRAAPASGSFEPS